jgi:hypothetical protein
VVLIVTNLLCLFLGNRKAQAHAVFAVLHARALLLEWGEVMATKRRSSANYLAIDGKRFRTSRAAKQHSERLQSNFRSQAEYDEKNGTDNGGDPAIQAWQDMHNHEMNS